MKPVCTHSGKPSRRGIVLIGAIVALAVLSLTSTIIVREAVAQRRLLERRHWQLQGAALARAGVEHAAARLLSAPDGYEGEALSLVPQADLQITVAREPGAAPIYRVSTVARFPSDVPAPVVHTLVQRFRRVTQGQDVRMEPLPPEPATDVSP